jgi:hypothetical protein
MLSATTATLAFLQEDDLLLYYSRLHNFVKSAQVST